MTVREALNLDPSLPRLDRDVLLSYALGRDRVFLAAHSEERLTPSQVRRYRALLARAAKYEPIAYILGEKEFFGLPFFVNRATLIPRPETELLVERELQKIEAGRLTVEKKKNKFFLRNQTSIIYPRTAIVDVGTGSGCIITSIVKNLPSSVIDHQSSMTFFATDISAAALRIARKNATRHQVKHLIRFSESDLLTRLEKPLARFDEIVVIANLPYLSASLYRFTAPNVRRYEPKSALLSGAGGLAHYGRLLKELSALSRNGTLVHFFLEISPEQAKKVNALFRGISVLSSLEILPDLAGKPRIVAGTLGVLSPKAANKNPA